jgi:NitT/TauT family transport system ATP-binding protein/nitrate/nitrite transport system substrate-binding protein
MTKPLRIGLLRLTDSAPVIIAQEFGFFADEGVEASLTVEPSWANVADKLAYGALDAASFLPPLAFAVTLGLRGAAQPLAIPFGLSLGGDTITLERSLAASLREEARAAGASAVFAARLKQGDLPPLATVHELSTHSLLLRYWLAAAGAVAGRDYELVVVPPSRTVEALQSGRICGFCAGAPWGEVASRAGVGLTVATSYDIWRHGPEKAFALRERWIDENPEACAGALRALYRAARFCDQAQNASYVASLLSRRAWLGLDSHAILSTLPGGAGPRFAARFHTQAANFPWRSQALWFLAQMRRWDLIGPDVDLEALARRVYRPEIYAAALSPIGAPIPLSDSKPEGAHDAPWRLPASPTPIGMEPDPFCDGAVFDPSA